MTNSEHLLVNNQSSSRIYKRRWYVLCILSILSCIQNAVWSSWGPIAQTAEAVYNWEDSTIFMLVNSGNIAFIVFIIPATWLLEKKGLRLSIIICCVILAVATGVRCITSEPKYATWLIFAGQSLNGVAGTVAFAGPPLLSEVWFPHNQRTTATAIGLLFSSVGSSLAFIVGPQIVPQPSSQENCTIGHMLKIAENQTNRNLTDISEMRNRVMIFNYLQFGLAVLLLISSLVYFPSKPPTPPSATAAMNRINFGRSVKNIVRTGPFWHIALIYGFSTGVYGVLGSTLDVILNHVGISQKDAGWLGFYGNVSAAVAGFILSRFADIFLKHMRIFLVIVYSTATLFFIWFTLMSNEYMYFNKGLLYIAYIGGSLFLIGSMPLFYEISCEKVYPIPEEVTAGFLSLLQNIGGTLVLLISLVPNIGSKWINWCLISAVGLSAIGLAFFKEDYNRTNIDINVHKTEVTCKTRD